MSQNESNNQLLFIGIAILIVLCIGGYSYLTKTTTSLSEDDQALLDELKADDEVYAEDRLNVLKDDDTIETMSDNINEKLQTPKPELQIDSTKSYSAVLKTTEGDIKIKLYADKTPITANNFVYLARRGFYNDTIFHRVIDGFMIQGGDPIGNGTGGPAYKFDDEKFDGQYNRGIIAMANSGPNTNGSQFFIMHQDNPLPKNYVIFGEVISGIEVVDKIATANVAPSAMGEISSPVNPVKITEAVIEEN